MNKLYWIVCEENHTTLFEGRFQGRTRCAAMKFLKDQIGRKSLSGVVFTITEIPVPLIREIVAEFLTETGIPASPPTQKANGRPKKADKLMTPDAPKNAAPAKETPTKAKPKAVVS